MRSVSKRKQITTIITVPNQFILVFALYLLYSNFSMAKTHQRKPQGHQNKHTTQRKYNLSKQNSLQQSDYFEYFCNSTNSENLGKPEKFVYQSTVQNLEFFVACMIFKNCNSGRKSFCFSARSKQLSPKKILKVFLGTNTN